MASLNPENPFNPAIRCVSSSKFPVCTDRPLPICDVFGSVDVNSNLAIAQDTFERLTFSGTPVANNCVWDSTNNQFLIQKAGNYTVSYDVAVDGATVAVANSFIGVNAAASGAGNDFASPVRYAGQNYSANGESANLSGSLVIALEEGDLVGVYVSEDGNNAAVTLLAEARLSLHALTGNFQ